MKILLLTIFGLSLNALAWAATGQVSDFKLSDLNPRSNRKAGTVSPRDYRLQVSGYYFGQAH
jgi:hypothetical protein